MYDTQNKTKQKHYLKQSKVIVKARRTIWILVMSKRAYLGMQREGSPGVQKECPKKSSHKDLTYGNHEEGTHTRKWRAGLGLEDTVHTYRCWKRRWKLGGWIEMWSLILLRWCLLCSQQSSKGSIFLSLGVGFPLGLLLGGLGCSSFLSGCLSLFLGFSDLSVVLLSINYAPRSFLCQLNTPI